MGTPQTCRERVPKAVPGSVPGSPVRACVVSVAHAVAMPANAGLRVPVQEKATQQRLRNSDVTRKPLSLKASTLRLRRTLPMEPRNLLMQDRKKERLFDEVLTRFWL